MTAALRPFRVIAKRVKAFRGRRGGSTKSATSAEAGPKLVDLPAKNRWLLISNCQAIGLARAMQMVNPDFRITPMGHWAAVRDPQRTCQEALTGGYSGRYGALIFIEMPVVPHCNRSVASSRSTIGNW